MARRSLVQYRLRPVHTGHRSDVHWPLGFDEFVFSPPFALLRRRADAIKIDIESFIGE